MDQREQQGTEAQDRYWYRSCGLTIVSALPLDDLAERAVPGTPDLSIELVGEARIDAYARATTHVVSIGEVGSPWLEVRTGLEGYLARWPETLDVLIPNDGRKLLVCPRGEARDSLTRLLLCQALSFALPMHRREALHASAVEVDGRAIVLAGRSGRGKSTLGAALCRAGGRLLSDDLGVIRIADDGVLMVDRSTTKAWLFREVAAEMFGEGAGIELNRVHKIAIGGDGLPTAAESVPLGALFLLGHRTGTPVISEPLSGKRAMVGFLSSLFNFVVRAPERLDVQFRIATEVSDRVPVRTVQWDPSPRLAEELAGRIIATVAGTEPVAPLPQPNGHHVAAPPDLVTSNGDGIRRTMGRETRERSRLVEELRRAGIGMPDDKDEPLLRTSEVAALLRSSDRTIRTWADAGKLPYIKTLGGRRLFPASAVMAVLRSMRGELREED